MILTGVTAHGVELAEMLATLLQRHGYTDKAPQDLDELLEIGRKAVAEGVPAPAGINAEQLAVLAEVGYTFPTSDLKRPYWEREDEASEDFDTLEAAHADAWRDAGERAMDRRDISVEDWNMFSYDAQKTMILNDHRVFGGAA